MANDNSTKLAIQGFAREAKELAAEIPAADFALIPAEQRTRAAAAINELQAAQKDDVDPAYPFAALAHVLDEQAEPTKVKWVDVLGTLSEGLQVELDKPGAATVRAAADPESGVRKAAATADELRRHLSGAVDTYKINKKAHEALRALLFGERGQPKSRAEWEIEIGSIASALRRPQAKVPPELRAFLPRVEASQTELKAATAQSGKARSDQITWSAGVREAGYALALGLARLLAQSFTKAVPARHGRLLRAIDPKRSADAGAKAAKGKPGAGETGEAGGTTAPPADGAAKAGAPPAPPPAATPPGETPPTS